MSVMWSQGGTGLLVYDNGTLRFIESGPEFDALKEIASGWQMTESTNTTIEEQRVQIRSKRDSLLTASDWTQVSDAPVNQSAWAEYRQALRDIPQQEGFPIDVAWPVKP
jgi:hypothetical protein